ncbi:hypothetical protein SLS63_005283 [Diaporthe eres]|uniref:S-adenosyl-L-methionine-dependent methyltransferase n=1 Tax=Diaporthe eres TaxID=83184 RepID=A0ABR1PB56_DIAER
MDGSWPNPSNFGAPSVRDPAAYPQPGWTMTTQSATPYYDGHVLPASDDPIPERDLRIVSGGSIIEADSMLDEESGRTYQDHPTARYMFPNDPAEQDRADLQHKICRIYHGGALHRAPVGLPRNVLEIATGTGLWAIQYAAEHPGCQVTGTDISRIQPSKIPDNCSFVKEDSEHDEWIFQDPFGFIYMRLVSCSFDDYPTVFRKCFDNLEPGGWLELNDSTFVLACEDGSIRGTNIEKWSQRMSEAQATMGRDPEVPKKYRRWMVETGFVDVVEQVGLLPGNPWPEDPKLRELGKWQMTSLYRGLRGLSFKLLRALGMPPEAVEELISAAREDLRNTRLHFSFPIYVVYGRKPYEWEISQRVGLLQR